MKWPPWWDWDLEIAPHVYKRMEDRDFNEVELRQMLHDAQSYRPDVIEGRWIVAARFRRVSWEIIVEPDPIVEILTVITAYPIDL